MSATGCWIDADSQLNDYVKWCSLPEEMLDGDAENNLLSKLDSWVSHLQQRLPHATE